MEFHNGILWFLRHSTAFLYTTVQMLKLHTGHFLQRGSIPCYAEHCISYDGFCLTV